jgi:hypothetical protein
MSTSSCLSSTTGVKYLGQDIVKGRWVHDGEADKEDIGLRVRQRAETVVIFLSSSVPQVQPDARVVFGHDGRREIVEAVRIVSNISYCRQVPRTYTVGIYSSGNTLVV